MPTEYRDPKTNTLLFKSTAEDNFMIKTMKDNKDLKTKVNELEVKINKILVSVSEGVNK